MQYEGAFLLKKWIFDVVKQLFVEHFQKLHHCLDDVGQLTMV